ncbi:MAG: enoyl-CoA hydratase-related protein [Pseudomonadota bacterium]
MADDYTTIRCAAPRPGVVELRLARPEKRNAMDADMIRELHTAFLSLGADPDVRVIVMAAEGDVFCAGGDLEWMRTQSARSRAGRIEGASELAHMLGAIDTCPNLVIARVQGRAFGGGLGLLCVSDVVISTNLAEFSLTETRLGLIPATIGPFVIRRMGAGMARQIFYSGAVFGTEFGLRSGLITEAVLPNELDECAARQIEAALNTAPGASVAAKALWRDLAGHISPEVVERSIEALAERWETGEAAAGIDAFLSRRPMPWAP